MEPLDNSYARYVRTNGNEYTGPFNPERKDIIVIMGVNDAIKRRYGIH